MQTTEVPDCLPICLNVPAVLLMSHMYSVCVNCDHSDRYKLPSHSHMCVILMPDDLVFVCLCSEEAWALLTDLGLIFRLVLGILNSYIQKFCENQHFQMYEMHLAMKYMHSPNLEV